MFCEQLDYNLLFRWFLDLNWSYPDSVDGEGLRYKVSLDDKFSRSQWAINN
jgi:hypothetical protein